MATKPKLYIVFTIFLMRLNYCSTMSDRTEVVGGMPQSSSTIEQLVSTFARREYFEFADQVAKLIVNLISASDRANPANQSFMDISNTLHRIEKYMASLDTSDAYVYQYQDVEILKEKLSESSKIIDSVHEKFKNLMNYSRENSPREKKFKIEEKTDVDTHWNFMNQFTTLRNYLWNPLPYLGGDSILDLLHTHAKKSLHRRIHLLYRSFLLAQIRGYCVLHTYLSLKDDPDPVDQPYIESVFQDTLKRVKTLLENMESADRTFYIHDLAPRRKDEKSKTYTSLDNLFNRYVINEAALNEAGSCNGECFNYKKVTNISEEGAQFDHLHGKRKVCSGKLFNCHVVDKSRICFDKFEGEYKIIATKNNMINGRECLDQTLFSTSTFPKLEANELTLLGGPFSLFGLAFTASFNCDYCSCTCEDSGKPESDRFISLERQESDVRNNYVVTGLRFMKKDHVLHVEIKEGILLPNGLIDNDNNRWKISNEFDPISKQGLKNYSIITEELEDVGLSANRFNLDNLDVEEMDKQLKEELGITDNDTIGLVTGAAFGFTLSTAGNKTSRHYTLELKITHFNVTSGKLRPEFSHWYTYPEHGNRDRTVYRIENRALPTTSDKPADMVSLSNQCVEFATSSWTKDAGRHTIPFIDLKEVETNPPTPLSGAGLFLKGDEKTGGYLAMKLFTVDYRPFISHEIIYDTESNTNIV